MASCRADQKSNSEPTAPLGGTPAAINIIRPVAPDSKRIKAMQCSPRRSDEYKFRSLVFGPGAAFTILTNGLADEFGFGQIVQWSSGQIVKGITI